MKNKFMTKALAVVLSASMALSLSSATALTANGAAAPKLAKKAVTVKVGKKAKNKLAKASFKAGWRITKATVKKTKVAKATVKKNKKVVVLTGVQKGKSKVVVALKNAKTGAAKKVKFTVKVKVDEVKPEPEPVVEAASIVSATQTTVDEAVITFSKAPETDVTRDTMKIYEGGKEYVPTAVTMAADKLSATVSYAYAASTDTTTYEYTFKDANLSGEASFKTAKYEVAKIDVKDQTVEAGSLQPVTFALLTENGVDITKANAGKLLKDVNVDFVGDDVVDKSQSSTNPQVFLSAAGKTCKMTVTYLPGQEKEMKAEATITAVQPTQTKAEARWADNRLRWYLDDDNVTSLSLYSGDPAKTMYFYAKQTVSNNALTFKAVEYGRGFDIKSSDEDVATVTVKAVTNKLAEVLITPLTAGTTTITLIATEEKGEGIEAKYELPVRVNDFNHDSAEFKASTTAVSLTNAVDNDWSAKVGLNLFNPNNEADDHSYTVEVYDSKNNATDAITVEEDHARTWDSTLGAHTYHINIWPFDKGTTAHPGSRQPALAGTYRVVLKATGVQGSDTKDFEKTIFVNVKDVASKIDANTTFKYEFALGSTSLELKDDGKTDSTTVSIKAMIGSDFAGYVRRSNSTGDYYIGQYNATVVDNAVNGTGHGIQIYVLSGAKYVREDCVDTAAGKNATFYLGSEAVSAKEAGDLHYGVYDSYSSGNNTDSKNLAVVSLYSNAAVAGDTAPINYFGNSKNEGIATAGTYNIIAYNYDETVSAIDPSTGKLRDEVSTLASKKAISVSYKLTMPYLDYNRVAREDYVTPDKDFLENGVNNTPGIIRVVVADDRFATYKVAHKNASVDDWASANVVKNNDRLAPKDKAKAVIIAYTDRAGGKTINFVVEKDNTITE